MTRSSTKMTNEFKNLLDDAVKSLASKEDLDSLKILIKDQSDTINFLICQKTLAWHRQKFDFVLAFVFICFHGNNWWHVFLDYSLVRHL